MMNRQDFAVTIAFTRLRTGTHAAHPDECSAYSFVVGGHWAYNLLLWHVKAFHGDVTI